MCVFFYYFSLFIDFLFSVFLFFISSFFISFILFNESLCSSSTLDEGASKISHVLRSKRKAWIRKETEITHAYKEKVATNDYKAVIGEKSVCEGFYEFLFLCIESMPCAILFKWNRVRSWKWKTSVKMRFIRGVRESPGTGFDFMMELFMLLLFGYNQSKNAFSAHVQYHFETHITNVAFAWYKRGTFAILHKNNCNHSCARGTHCFDFILWCFVQQKKGKQIRFAEIIWLDILVWKIPIGPPWYTKKYDTNFQLLLWKMMQKEFRWFFSFFCPGGQFNWLKRGKNTEETKKKTEKTKT